MHTDKTPHTDGEYEMPSVEALLAGTLALMTGHAQSACARQRSLMSKKIASNLVLLSAHPTLSAPFRTVIERMRPHWQVLAQWGDNGATSSMAQPLWHAAAARVQ